MQTQDFVVYRTLNGITIEIDDDCTNRDEYMTRHAQISFILAKIYSYLPENLTGSEPINRQIARGIGINALGEHEEAKNILEDALSRVTTLKKVKSKLAYTEGALSLVVLIALVNISFYILNCSDTLQLFAHIVFCGSLGGILSIMIGYNDLNIDMDADNKTNQFIGISRIFIASIASLFAYFAIKSGVAFSFLENTESNNGIYLVAMISGFVEMFIPNMMNNIIAKNEQKES